MPAARSCQARQLVSVARAARWDRGATAPDPPWRLPGPRCGRAGPHTPADGSAEPGGGPVTAGQWLGGRPAAKPSHPGAGEGDAPSGAERRNSSRLRHYQRRALRGLCRGEACGLRWCDIDLDAATAVIAWHLQQFGGHVTLCPPKTAHSERIIAPDRTTVAVPRAHIVLQQLERAEAGDRYHDSRYVLTGLHGDLLARPPVPVLPSACRLRRPPADPAARPPARRSQSRPRRGADLKVVQDMLGHSSIVLTADTYTSVLPDVARKAGRRHGLPHHRRRLPRPRHPAPPPPGLAHPGPPRARRPRQRTRRRSARAADLQPAPPHGAGDRPACPAGFEATGRIAQLRSGPARNHAGAGTPTPWSTSAHSSEPDCASGAKKP